MLARKSVSFRLQTVKKGLGGYCAKLYRYGRILYGIAECVQNMKIIIPGYKNVLRNFYTVRNKAAHSANGGLTG